MNRSIFSFNEYKQYLKNVLDDASETSHGTRTQWAHQIGCHSTYISQVLNKNAHLSLEQGLKLSRFLKHSETEQNYFLLLINHARAGTKELKAFFHKEIVTSQNNQLTLRNQIKDPENLKSIKETKYYSSWQFAAVHVGLSVPSLSTDQALSRYLGISSRRTKEIIRKLELMELIRVHDKGQIEVLKNSVHLEAGSDQINRHHTNWRLQAINAMERTSDLGLHYSSVITASNEDIPQIKSIMLQAIEKIRAIVRQAKDEDVFSYAMDFFPLRADVK